MSAQRPMSTQRLACPNCLSPDHLGENVLGWRRCGPPRLVDGELVVPAADAESSSFGRDVYDAERVSFFCSNSGCDVDSPIRDSELVAAPSETRRP
jgi:hypothetical protein